MKNLITICARGGSKGIPGKNIKNLNAKPLIYYTVRVAEAFLKRNPGTQIFLSTDSPDIKDHVGAISSEVNITYTRSQKLATDDSGKMEVIKDILAFAENVNGEQFDYVIDLDVTSPLRTVDDLEKSLATLKYDPNAYNIFSVNPANRNPYFNMVEEKKESHYVNLVKKGNFLTRQSAPKVYDMNASFYIYRRNFFTQDFVSAITDRSLIYKTPHICFDLDHPIDFKFMEYLIEENLLDFDLTT